LGNDILDESQSGRSAACFAGWDCAANGGFIKYVNALGVVPAAEVPPRTVSCQHESGSRLNS